MEIREYIQHPELMDRDSLYELRSLLAQYPYFQTIRLLLLQNLYLLHDPDFDEELRRAAIFMTDRKVIFQLIEAFHYQLTPQPSASRQPTMPRQCVNTASLHRQMPLSTTWHTCWRARPCRWTTTTVRS